MATISRLGLVLLTGTAHASTLFCSNVTQLEHALESVQPGDEIVLESGTVFASPSVYSSAAHFTSSVDGTAASPIVLRSDDSTNPATLKGADPQSLTVLRLFGDFWTVRDLIVTNAQKGIVFDNADYGNVVNCTVHGIGSEGIHWRNGSQNGLIDSCHIHDTGLVSPGFGEGVYIGTDKGSWTTYDPYVSNVTVRHCVFGPQIAAEALDIKEGTSDILVENNTFDATGISLENYADSFIDLKGTYAVVRYNTFLQNSEPNLKRGVDVSDRGVSMSGYEHAIHDNVFDMESLNSKMVETHTGTYDVYAWNNVREPSNGATYSPSVIDECCPPWYSPPGDDGDSTCPTPTMLGASQVTKTSATLSWVAIDTATSYTLSLQDESTGKSWQVTDITAASHALQDLNVDTIYTVRIRADHCEPNFSSPVTTFRTLDIEE